MVGDGVVEGEGVSGCARAWVIVALLRRYAAASLSVVTCARLKSFEMGWDMCRTLEGERYVRSWLGYFQHRVYCGLSHLVCVESTRYLSLAP
jgi:hypothetical protein